MDKCFIFSICGVMKEHCPLLFVASSLDPYSWIYFVLWCSFCKNLASLSCLHEQWTQKEGMITCNCMYNVHVHVHWQVLSSYYAFSKVILGSYSTLSDWIYSGSRLMSYLSCKQCLWHYQGYFIIREASFNTIELFSCDKINILHHFDSYYKQYLSVLACNSLFFCSETWK